MAGIRTADRFCASARDQAGRRWPVIIFESDHLDGDVDMIAVLKILLAENKKRSSQPPNRVPAGSRSSDAGQTSPRPSGPIPAIPRSGGCAGSPNCAARSAPSSTPANSGEHPCLPGRLERRQPIQTPIEGCDAVRRNLRGSRDRNVTRAALLATCRRWNTSRRGRDRAIGRAENRPAFPAVCPSPRRAPDANSIAFPAGRPGSHCGPGCPARR